MKKNIVFATLILLALSLSGCKMAEINPRAICLYFNFYSPDSYPFLRKINLTLGDYFEINEDIATVDCYIYNPSQKRWDIPQGYWISYKLTGIWFPTLEKHEGYEDNKLYSNEKIIILPKNIENEILIKLVVRIKNDLSKSKYYIYSTNLSSKKIKQYNEKYFLFMDYSIYYPIYTINLPGWDKWNVLK